MKLHNSLVLMSLLALITGCQNTAPEITLTDAWSRPVELVANSGCNHENKDNAKAKPACCTKDEGTNPKADCCTNKSNGVVYLKIKNSGGQSDRLLSASSEVAHTVEIHESKMAEDHMSMQKIEGGIEIPAGKTIELKPGGYHIMLIGLKQALKVDDEFSVDLQFEKSAPIKVASKIRLY